VRLLSVLAKTSRESTDEDFGKGDKHIMKIYDAIDTPKQLYLVLESCGGKMLSQVLMKEQSLNGRIASRVFG